MYIIIKVTPGLVKFTLVENPCCKGLVRWSSVVMVSVLASC